MMFERLFDIFHPRTENSSESSTNHVAVKPPFFVGGIGETISNRALEEFSLLTRDEDLPPVIQALRDVIQGKN